MVIVVTTAAGVIEACIMFIDVRLRCHCPVKETIKDLNETLKNPYILPVIIVINNDAAGSGGS